MCFCSLDSSKSSVISRWCQELHSWRVISSQEKFSICLCFQAAVVFLVAIILLGRMRCVMRQKWLWGRLKQPLLCTFPLSYELVRSLVIRNSWPCCLLRHDIHSWQHDWSFCASPLDIWFAEDTCKLLAKIWCWTFIGINSLSIFVEKEHLLWQVSG